MIKTLSKAEIKENSFNLIKSPFKNSTAGFPGGSVVKNLPANAGDTDLIPGSVRSHTLRSNSAHAPLPLEPGSHDY